MKVLHPCSSLMALEGRSAVCKCIAPTTAITTTVRMSRAIQPKKQYSPSEQCLPRYPRQSFHQLNYPHHNIRQPSRSLHQNLRQPEQAHQNQTQSSQQSPDWLKYPQSYLHQPRYPHQHQRYAHSSRRRPGVILPQRQRREDGANEPLKAQEEEEEEEEEGEKQGGRRKGRVIYYTIIFAVVTVLGAWYGAGLKTQTQVEEKRAEIRGLSVTARIDQLRGAREKLVQQKKDIETKITELQRRSSRNKSQDGDNSAG